jgi:hypothetical protein
MKASKILPHFIILIVLHNYLLYSQNVLTNTNGDNSLDIIGTYEYIDSFHQTKIIIDSNYKFYYWRSNSNDVFGYSKEPITFGKCVKTRVSGLYNFISDKTPLPPKLNYDENIKGYKIIFHSDDNETLSFTSILVIYKDKYFNRYIDSTNFILLDEPNPIKIEVDNPDHCDLTYYFDSTSNYLEILEDKDYYQNRSVILCGDIKYNMIELYLDDDYLFFNGQLFLFYNEYLYSLNYPLDRLKKHRRK